VIIHGRILNVYICQNLDRSTFGSVLDVSNNISNIGKIGWALDAQLTETSINDLNIDLFDNPGWTIWNWLKSNLASTQGNLPAFLLVILGGVVKFYGIVNFDEIQLEEETVSIKITSHNWFSMASLEILNSTDANGNATSWSRQPVPIPLNRPQTVDIGTSFPSSTQLVGKGSGGDRGGRID
jgi:hypothetical protein